MPFLPIQNISLNDIHQAVGGSAQTTVSLNDADVRAFLNPDIFYSGGVVDQRAGDTIFNSWVRISHDTTGVYPANSSEITSWIYDNDGGIESTINSVTFIGFISSTTQKYDDYVLEAKITSTNADNDRLAVIIAYTEENGVQHTLSAVRNQDGNTTITSWSLWYNFAQASQTKILDGSSLIPYVGVNNWNTYPEGTTIRIEREGDIVRAYSTDPGSTILKGQLTVDLSTVPLLEKFRGPQQIGFGCSSQANALFKPISFFYGGDLVEKINTTSNSQISVGEFRNGEYGTVSLDTITLSGTPGSPNLSSTIDQEGISATVIWEFRPDGTVYKTPLSANQQVFFENWSSNIPPAGSYWIRATVTSGLVSTPSSSPTDTWISLTSLAAWYWEAVGPGQTTTGSIKVEISDQSDGSNILATGYYQGTASTSQ
jgi:hypothetical protein